MSDSNLKNRPAGLTITILFWGRKVNLLGIYIQYTKTDTFGACFCIDFVLNYLISYVTVTFDVIFVCPAGSSGAGAASPKPTAEVSLIAL